MRKSLILALVVVTIGFSGCGDGSNPQVDPVQDQNPQPDKLTFYRIFDYVSVLSTCDPDIKFEVLSAYYNSTKTSFQLKNIDGEIFLEGDFNDSLTYSLKSAIGEEPADCYLKYNPCNNCDSLVFRCDSKSYSCKTTWE